MINGNFCWIATWKITDRCNLRCTYCDPSIMKRAGEAEETDRFEALGRIAACRPRILNISGGEPALVKELPELLAKAKASWNPFIRVVHNGTAPHKLIDSFPFIDRLVISIDGPGEVNAATRGIGGDAVLERIAGIINSAGPSPEIIINTVVTESNIGALPRFAAEIAGVSPRITLALLPVMPVDGELSVLRNRGGGKPRPYGNHGGVDQSGPNDGDHGDRQAGYRRFLDTYAKMKASHSLTVHNFDCVMRHGDLRKIRCYNQYFTVRFSPRGEFFACGSNIGSQFRRTDGVFKKIFKKGGIKKALTILARAVSGKMGKTDFTCRTPCNCDSWLDMLLLGKDTGYAPILLQGLKGRLDENDYRELDTFVKTNINPDFDIDGFRKATAID